jgi:hypothetical protein
MDKRELVERRSNVDFSGYIYVVVESFDAAIVRCGARLAFAPQRVDF